MQGAHQAPAPPPVCREAACHTCEPGSPCRQRRDPCRCNKQHPMLNSQSTWSQSGCSTWHKNSPSSPYFKDGQHASLAQHQELILFLQLYSAASCAPRTTPQQQASCNHCLNRVQARGPYLHHPRWLIYIHRGVCLRPIGRPPPCILLPLPQHRRCSTDRNRAAAAIAATLLLPAVIAAAPCALLPPGEFSSSPCCNSAARSSAAEASPGDTVDFAPGDTSGSHCAAARPWRASEVTVSSLSGQ